jgi:beta-barrel assembly-enhancing protease
MRLSTVSFSLCKRGGFTMKRILMTLTALLAMIILSAAVQAETVKTAVKETQGRSGPGSFYELKVLIPQGTMLEVIEKQKSWYKVTYQKQVVWVSINSLSLDKSAAKETASDPFSSLSMGNVQVKASPATLTAAIKGFWTRYSGNRGTKLYELPIEGYPLDIAAYESFSRIRIQTTGRDKLWDRYPLPARARAQDIDYEKEHSIGYSIASSLADAPPVTDKALNQYITSVGLYVAESTERYDIAWTFYILDTDRINAVSCPGGYIVLTRGLLKLLADESELAALLAHEMAHVVAGHAMQTLEENKVARQADSAFDLLSKETKVSEVETDLTAITSRAVSIATSPKLDEQEFEADRMALRYLARSGYDQGGLTRMLETMRTRHENAIDMFDLNYRNHPDFRERARRIGRELESYRNYQGSSFRNEFSSSMIR